MSLFKQNQKLGPAATIALCSYFPKEEAAFAFTLGPCDLWSALDHWDRSVGCHAGNCSSSRNHSSLQASREACLFQAAGFKFTEFQHGQKNLHRRILIDESQNAILVIVCLLASLVLRTNLSLSRWKPSRAWSRFILKVRCPMENGLISEFPWHHWKLRDTDSTDDVCDIF